MSKEVAATLSAKEMQLLAAAWMSCDVPPKPNYEKIASICGYKNAMTASVMFGGVRRKLAATVSTDDKSGSSPAKKTPTSAKKRAADDADDTSETPTSKKRARKPKVEKVKKEEEVDNEEEFNFDQLPDMDSFDEGALGF